MPKTRPSATSVAKALSFVLIQARPEPSAGRAVDVSAAMVQWETDVLAVSLAVQTLTGYDDSRFRRDCQGPKGEG